MTEEGIKKIRSRYTKKGFAVFCKALILVTPQGLEPWAY